MSRLDFEFAPIDVTIIDHEKALTAGIEAFGLWAWGQCYARKHKTGGRIPRVAALAAFGCRRNSVLISRLITSGLWLSREDGDIDVHNYEAKGGEPPAPKATSTERVRAFRAKKRNADETLGNAFPSYSVSSSVSVSSSGEGAGEGPPAWWDAAASTAEMSAGPVGDRAARWLEYRAARERKGWPVNQTDAAGWLSSVVRAERARAPRGPASTKQPLGAAAGAPWADPNRNDGFGEVGT